MAPPRPLIWGEVAETGAHRARKLLRASQRRIVTVVWRFVPPWAPQPGRHDRQPPSDRPRWSPDHGRMTVGSVIAYAGAQQQRAVGGCYRYGGGVASGIVSSRLARAVNSTCRKDALTHDVVLPRAKRSQHRPLGPQPRGSPAQRVNIARLPLCCDVTKCQHNARAPAVQARCDPEWSQCLNRVASL